MQYATDVAVIGGGAGGIFTAINLARFHPECRITVLEKSARLLSKVRISGGGRCNVTHACFDPAILATYYPRGGTELRELFQRFQPRDTIAWFAERGVALKTEEDGRMFPATNRSQTIIDCFLDESEARHIDIRMRHHVQAIERTEAGFVLTIAEHPPFACRYVVVASGGFQQPEAYDFISRLGIRIVPPVPSLFTFNLPEDPLTRLPGLSCPAAIRLEQGPYAETGALLVTHWGVSGPAVLKLSSRAARFLSEKNYHFNFFIDWLPGHPEAELKTKFEEWRGSGGKNKIATDLTGWMPKRLRDYLLEKAGIHANRNWAETGKKQIAALLEILKSDRYTSRGRTPYKQEFVQCGGVALDEVDMATMESKKIKGLFFTGEVLDMDALTGGFNFQAAWTTAYVAAGSVKLAVGSWQ